jgi:hypothetical protein
MATPTYIPSETPSDITSTAYIRQNPWEKIYDILESVKVSNKLHIPYAHHRDTVHAFQTERTTFLRSIPEKHRSPVDTFTKLPIGTIVLVPNGVKGLLVKLKSEIKGGILDSLCLVCSPRTCGHIYVHHGGLCHPCHDSVRDVPDSRYAVKLRAHLAAGYLIEPFYSLYFDVEVLGHVDYNGTNGSKIAQPASMAQKVNYWKLRG